ncbi:hypothetical protein [Sphingopyxis sp. BSNA05]|nr:hypothetical protein [Sphingopyxis sp. BSNA05]
MSYFLDRLDPAFRDMIEADGPFLFEILKSDARSMYNYVTV